MKEPLCDLLHPPNGRMGLVLGLICHLTPPIGYEITYLVNITSKLLQYPSSPMSGTVEVDEAYIGGMDR